MLSVQDVEEILAIPPLLGVIPESQIVLNASNQGLPVILEEQSDAGQAYEDAVARLLGEEREHRFMTSQKKRLLLTDVQRGGLRDEFFFDYFRSKKNSTASVAKERLQIIVAHERGGQREQPDYLPSCSRSCCR